MDNVYAGAIATFAFSTIPEGWMQCNGQTLQPSKYPILFSVIGIRYGGDGISTFVLPNLTDTHIKATTNRLVVGCYSDLKLIGAKSGAFLNAPLSTELLYSHTHSMSSTAMQVDASGNVGSSSSPVGNYLSTSSANVYIDKFYANGKLQFSPNANFIGISPAGGGSTATAINAMPSLAVNYCICVEGDSPFNYEVVPIAGQLIIMAGTQPPGYYTNGAAKYYLLCNGQELPIAAYQMLYALIGNKFGGNGKSTFMLPNLSNSTVIGSGQGPGLQNYPYGSNGGAYSVDLSAANMPAHTHAATEFGVIVSAGAGSSDIPNDNYLSDSPAAMGPMYATKADQPVLVDYPNATVTLDNTGTGTTWDNTNPNIALAYWISYNGTFPQRQ